MKMSATLKVGILIILSTCILIVGIMWLKGRSISIGETIEVHFKDIDGMRPGSAVQIMGMRIGQVDEIEPVIDGENSYVIVKFVINHPDIKVPPASTISIQQSGIIGEKFLEVTPPFSKTVFVPLEEQFEGTIPEGSEVELLVGEKYLKVGQIKDSQKIDTKTLSAERQRHFKSPSIYKIRYFIDFPKIQIPVHSKIELVKAEKDDEQYNLRFTPPDDVVIELSKFESKYTVEEPLRMKEFMDIQLESASALKETNDKINKLFTDEFMSDVKYTVENTRDLSEKAGIIADQVAFIVESSREDIDVLISSATKLSENMIVLSNNVNNIMQDSGFKENIITTAGSIKKTSDNFSLLLEDTKLQESLLNINSTTEDIAEISHYVNELTRNEEFNGSLGKTVVNLNNLMVKLTRIVDSVDDITVEEKVRIKEIINNSSEISNDLKQFSDKLNQRFLLLKLLF